MLMREDQIMDACGSSEEALDISSRDRGELMPSFGDVIESAPNHVLRAKFVWLTYMGDAELETLLIQWNPRINVKLQILWTSLERALVLEGSWCICEQLSSCWKQTPCLQEDVLNWNHTICRQMSGLSLFRALLISYVQIERGFPIGLRAATMQMVMKYSWLGEYEEAPFTVLSEINRKKMQNYWYPIEDFMELLENITRITFNLRNHDGLRYPGEWNATLTWDKEWDEESLNAAIGYNPDFNKDWNIAQFGVRLAANHWPARVETGMFCVFHSVLGEEGVIVN